LGKKARTPGEGDAVSGGLAKKAGKLTQPKPGVHLVRKVAKRKLGKKLTCLSRSLGTSWKFFVFVIIGAAKDTSSIATLSQNGKNKKLLL
jgi:hypothetical protein